MSCAAGVPEVAAPRLDSNVIMGFCVGLAGVAVGRLETGRTGKPCGHMTGSSADVARIDEVGLIRVFETGRCPSQHQTIIGGNSCRKDVCGRNVYGSAMQKRLT